MIFESHAHYDDEAFDEDRKELLDALPGQGIGRVINVCAEVEGWDRTVDLMERYPYIYGAVGVHPDDVGALDEEKIRRMHQICQMEKTVAVGEIGLDYYWDKESRDCQKKWFITQLDMAKETGLPVNIHSRDAEQETFEIMKKEHAGTTGGVIHCFSSSAQMALEYVKLGYYIGIGCVVTFKNARVMKEVAAAVPLDHIVIETDCPYLAPAPNRGKRNSSLYLPLVIREIAEIKGVTPKEVEDATYANVKRVYPKIQ